VAISIYILTGIITGILLGFDSYEVLIVGLGFILWPIFIIYVTLYSGDPVMNIAVIKSSTTVTVGFVFAVLILTIIYAVVPYIVYTHFNKNK